MIRAIIIDPQPKDIEVLNSLLEKTGQVEVVGKFINSLEALKSFSMMQPDVVFSDIEMPGINGIEMARRLSERGESADIIFVTALRYYAVEAFAVNAVDYLLKPVFPEVVCRAVSRVLKLRNVRPVSAKNHEAYICCVGNAIIRCFGHFRVCNSVEGNFIKWRTAKTEELFAYLLYHRNMLVLKEKIIDNLWPECEPVVAANNLHTTIYRLKKTLKMNGLHIVIQFSGGGYTMKLERDVFCDVDDFEIFAAQEYSVNKENIADFEAIASLYQGGYLEDKDYSWSLNERAKLEKYFSDMIKRMVHYYIDVAEYEKAEQVLLRALEILPYDEEVYELSLRLYFLKRNRAALIQQYQHFKDVLKKELGIEPQPSLTRLYEKLISSF